MAEPSYSTNLPDDTPRPSAPLDGVRTSHERELPLSASEADGSSHRVVEAPKPGAESQGAANADAGEPAIADAAADALTEDQVKLALRRVKDPELNLNILDLGLVYAIRVEGNGVSIDMTLTSPGCPSGPEIMTDAEQHLKAIPGVGDVAVNLVWSPFWSPEKIEPRVRAYLGF